MKWLLLMVLAFSYGCSPEVYHLAVDSDFTDHEVDMINDSVDQWMTACDCDAAGVFMRYDLHDNDDTLTYQEWSRRGKYGRMWKVYTSDPAYQQESSKRGSFTGLEKGTPWQNGNIAIVMDRIHSDAAFQAVVMHELGHMYGVGHLPTGLMAPTFDVRKAVYDCVDWDALVKFCDKHDCGPEAAPTCK